MNNESRTYTVALAGNPNSGKTTIFNNITGTNQHVGNYPGVTVEKKEGFISYGGSRLKIVDLPGTYSLSAHSIEEIIARNYVIKEKPDVVVDIIDASNIERNLFLTTQLLELKVPIILVLNMSDMARNLGVVIDMERLSLLLGVPVVATVGNKNRGTDELLAKVVEVVTNGDGYNPALVNYGKELEEIIASITSIMEKSPGMANGYQPRWIAIKLLEDDLEIKDHIADHEYSKEIFEIADNGRRRIESLFGDSPSIVVSDRRYGYISGACSEAVELAVQHRHDVSDRIDYFLIHPVLGLPIFAALMWLMFNLTFTFGEKPMEWIETAIEWLAATAATTLPAGLLNSLLVDGIIRGVGGVVVFLPNIMLLFLSIAVLEDTGYMARAAFVMDRIMHKIGLHGKSFIPMLIGFGCSVPAYMGSRILDDRTDRLVTMHVTTFMSCGARLPVYILICGAFWPGNAGNVIFSIYTLGVLVAIGMVKLLRATRFKGMSAPFIMELPPYRVPTLRSLFIHMWERSFMYLRKAGTIILAVSIVMWALMTFPQKTAFDRDYDTLEAQLATQQTQNQITNDEYKRAVNHLENEKAAELVSYSFAGRIGRVIEPVIRPLGFDWRLGVAIVSGFAAKEVVVSTMGTLYGVGDADEDSASLREQLAHDPSYNSLIAYAFLIFVLLYMPCMAAMAVFVRESGSWKELGYQFIYTTTLAYGMALIAYQGGKLIGLG